MGQVLHGSARTTQAIRAAIQRSSESPQSLARRHGINPETVAKWRKRTTTQFGNMSHQPYASRHIFGRVCDEHGIEHCFTKPAHPWTNGQVECMSRTLKESAVLRYHYETTAQLNEYLQAFLLAYNHAKRLKTLRGLTPHEFVCAQHLKNPVIFTRDPVPLTLGLYNSAF